MSQGPKIEGEKDRSIIKVRKQTASLTLWREKKMPQKKPIQRPLLLFAKVSSMLLLLRKIELPSVIVWKSFARDQNATQCFRVTSIHRKFITLRKKNTTTDVSMLHIGKEEAKKKKRKEKSCLAIMIIVKRTSAGTRGVSKYPPILGS